MKENNDRINELAFSLKGGDKTVFEELYRLTSSKAYFVALQISGDKHEAEDIVQESYIAVLSKIATLEKTEGFMSWFNRIVANKSKDYLRRKKPAFFGERKDEYLSEETSVSEKFSPEENVDRDELRNAVMDAIEELSVEKRACVLMKYFDDMTITDIAESIEVPVSTVKNRLWVARKELKAKFEKKGITAAYSVAPFGIVAWALNASFEIIEKTFNGSQAAANILSGITIAGTGVAVAAGTGAAATAGTTAAGTAAKAVAATTFQKIAAGAAIAGVVTGSTIGITSVVKNRKDDIPEIPTTSYTEYADVQSAVIPVIEEQTVNVADAVKNENKNKDENPKKYVDLSLYGPVPVGIDTVGELKLGNNTVYFDEGKKEEIYYAEFYAPETGYYAFSQELYFKTFSRGDGRDVNAIYGKVMIGFDNPLNESDITSAGSILSHNYCLAYLEEGMNYPIIARDREIGSYDMEIKYLGKEIEDVEFVGGVPEVVIGYNEDHSAVVTPDKERFIQLYNINVSFSSGEKIYLNNAEIDGFVEGGFNDGENNVTFEFVDYKINETVTAHYPDYYVKDIEITNLDEFCIAKVGYDGITYAEPESYEVIVTYGDGTKETLDGSTWNNIIKLDDGTELYVTFRTGTTYDREALRFSVFIGDYEYFSRLCTVTEFDLLGFKLEDINSDLYFFLSANLYVDNTADSFRNSESLEEYIYNTFAVVGSVFPELDNKVRYLWNDKLDDSITLYKICTENEFDLI